MKLAAKVEDIAHNIPVVYDSQLLVALRLYEGCLKLRSDHLHQENPRRTSENFAKLLDLGGLLLA